MTSLPPIADLTVDELLRRWPLTTRVFRQHDMACIGCALAPFYTVAEAVEAYGLSLDSFLDALQQAITEERLSDEAG